MCKTGYNNPSSANMIAVLLCVKSSTENSDNILERALVWDTFFGQAIIWNFSFFSAKNRGDITNYSQSQYLLNILKEILWVKAISAVSDKNLKNDGNNPTLVYAYGGFEIDKTNISNVKLSQIVNAIDGDSIYSGCGLGLEKCDENHPCPVHDKFKGVRDELKHMLEETNLEELALNIKSGASFLKL